MHMILFSALPVFTYCFFTFLHVGHYPVHYYETKRDINKKMIRYEIDLI